MTYEEFFAKVKEKFMTADVSDITEHLAYQFNITGEAEGIFYVEVKTASSTWSRMTTMTEMPHLRLLRKI